MPRHDDPDSSCDQITTRLLAVFQQRSRIEIKTQVNTVVWELLWDSSSDHQKIAPLLGLIGQSGSEANIIKVCLAFLGEKYEWELPTFLIAWLEGVFYRRPSKSHIFGNYIAYHEISPVARYYQLSMDIIAQNIHNWLCAEFPRMISRLRDRAWSAPKGEPFKLEISEEYFLLNTLHWMNQYPSAINWNPLLQLLISIIQEYDTSHWPAFIDSQFDDIVKKLQIEIV